MRRSTQDAHYTSELIVRTIWHALEALGFNGGKIFEPAFGTGHFWGLMPLELRTHSTCTAVELDPITAAIAQHLYPGARVHGGAPFQQFATANDWFDLAIGNPPFGSQLIFDGERREVSGLSIHNYFFARCIHSIRPGGLLAMVVSTYLLDAKTPRARKLLHDKARLIGAIRLPNTTFFANAGTEVSTDIIFLQRRRAAEPADELDWTKTTPIPDPAGGEPIDVNVYFAQHPEMVLGRIERTGSRFGPVPTVTPTGELASQLARALPRFPQNIYRALPSQTIEVQDTPAFDHNIAAQTKVYGYFVNEPGRSVMRRLPDLNGNLRAELILRQQYGSADHDRQRMACMIDLRDRIISQLRIETTGTEPDETIECRRQTLCSVYYTFRRYHGFLHDPTNKSLMRDDPQWPLLLAIESQYDKGLSRELAATLNVRSRPRSAKLGIVLTRRVRWPHREPTSATTSKDALLISLAQRGGLDLDYMRALTGFETERLLKDLGTELFLDPSSGVWQTRDAYLSGPVKKKLAAAEARLSQGDLNFARNVDALRPVIPTDLQATDIHVRAGAPWLPPDVMSAFATHLFGPRTKSTFGYLEALGRWAVSLQPGDAVADQEKWGTPRRTGAELFQALINNQPIRIYDQGPDDKLILNEEATQAAQDLANRMEAEFGDWIWRDPTRRARLTRIYNDLYNTHIERIFDGTHLTSNPDGSLRTLPGANPAITFRLHQANAIWRMIQQRGGGLLDHVVGAGKTFAIIAITMELRRLGLARRPMICVPNHLVGQWAKDFLLLYPDAKVLVPSKEDFTRERRQQLVAMIAASDWDAVIVAHSSFGFIDMPINEFKNFIDEQVHQIQAALEVAARVEGKRGRSVKQLEKFKDSLRARFEAKLEARERDKVVDFSELGVDFLAVDEAHEFKNLMFSTALRNVAGLGATSGSQKALDLFVKVRFIQKTYGGANVLFATGTPISNSIAELYTIQRYLQYDYLKEMGLLHFDAWQTTFATRTTDWEIDSTATGYKLKERLARFCNLPELMAMYRAFADVVTRADIDATRAAAGLKPLTPPLEGGAPLHIVAERSEPQATYMGAIVERAQNLKSADKRDNMLVITNDARKAALDMRLIDPAAQDHPDSKVNLAVHRIFEIWQHWQKRRGTQLLFCDLSTPKGARARESATLRALQEQAADGVEAAIEKLAGYTLDEIQSLQEGAFDVYNNVRTKLITLGIPVDEIAFIHDYHTDIQRIDLFESLREGRVRILLGSTAKMGTGMNVQKRLVAEHHLDTPWKPSQIEQRDGRIIRQGNVFYEGDDQNPPVPKFEIAIYRYSTRQTYDARMWQTNEAKANFIAQFRRGTSERAAEDVSAQAASAADMKAAASGNPLIVEEVRLQADIRKLETLRRAHLAKQHRLQDIIRVNADWQQRGERRIGMLQADLKQRIDAPDGEFGGMHLRQIQYTERRAGGLALISEIVQMQRARELERPDAGTYRGFPLSIELGPTTLAPILGIHANSGRHTAAYYSDDTLDPIGATRRLDHLIDNFEHEIQLTRERMDEEHNELISAQNELEIPFDKEADYQRVKLRHQEVLATIKANQSTPKAA